MPEQHPASPLIVGAGPVGLAAGLFLARHGIGARVIDKAIAPSPTSRALAVNPRTLELLAPSGITDSMLARGLPIRRVQFSLEGKPLAEFDLAQLHHRYNFMLALSQAATESLLAEAFQKLGGTVERGTELLHCRKQNGAVQATLQGPQDDESVTPAWLLGADGAHSRVRESLAVDFPGSSFPETWYLADVALATNLASDAAHIRFHADGTFLFLLPVISDIRRETGDRLWRVIGNFPGLFARLADATPTAAPVWQSHFHIAHRLASKLQAGNVYLAGDAAHIHSPMGARGMNLGIEDAFVFAELMKAGKAYRYDALRRPVDRRVVRRVALITRMARGRSPITRFLRRLILPRVQGSAFLHRRILATATGLDHVLDLS